MPNEFFRFKHFTIYQDKSAMKVCTDACILGAFAASYLQHTNTNGQRLLDIGAGTGLLSLMLAQKIIAGIDAIEIDADAAQQARENFAASPWAERITLHHISLQSFIEKQTALLTDQLQTHDIIISNPPFFSHHLRSSTEQKNTAKHTGNLPFPDLVDGIASLLSGDGIAFIMLPSTEMKLFVEMMEAAGLYVHTRINVRQTPAHNYFRAITVFGKGDKENFQESELTIRSGENYSHEFVTLLKDYYLAL